MDLDRGTWGGGDVVPTPGAELEQIHGGCACFMNAKVCDIWVHGENLALITGFLIVAWVWLHALN